MQAQDFLEAIEQNKFINNKQMQDDIYDFAFELDKPCFYLLLWHIAEHYPEIGFSTSFIADNFFKVATIDDMLIAIESLETTPIKKFAEAIFSTGTTEQIEQFIKIREGWQADYHKLLNVEEKSSNDGENTIALSNEPETISDNP